MRSGAFESMCHCARRPLAVLCLAVLATLSGTAGANLQPGEPIARQTAAEEVHARYPDAPDSPEEPRLHEEDSCRQIALDDDEMVDRARTQLEETTCSAALWFDGLFGDDRNLSAARGAYGRLETSLEYSDFYGSKTRTRFNLRVDLPNVQERLSIFVGRDREESIERDRAEGFALRSEFPQLDDRDQFFAGVGYGLPRRDHFNVGFRVGVRSLTSPRAFVQSRIEYLPYVDNNDILQLRLTPFYNTRDGFGITPGIDYSHVINPRLLVRWSNVGTLSEITEGFDWRSAVVLYQGLGWGRGLAYEAFVRGLTDAEVSLREYGLRLVYRQPILDHRMYLQPLLGYSWPKDESAQQREGAYLVGVGLELPFGREH